MNELPYEIVLHILKKLSWYNQIAKFVCVEWYNLIKSSKILILCTKIRFSYLVDFENTSLLDWFYKNFQQLYGEPPVIKYNSIVMYNDTFYRLTDAQLCVCFENEYSNKIIRRKYYNKDQYIKFFKIAVKSKYNMLISLMMSKRGYVKLKKILDAHKNKISDDASDNSDKNHYGGAETYIDGSIGEKIYNNPYINNYVYGESTMDFTSLYPSLMQSQSYPLMYYTN